MSFLEVLHVPRCAHISAELYLCQEMLKTESDVLINPGCTDPSTDPLEAVVTDTSTVLELNLNVCGGVELVFSDSFLLLSFFFCLIKGRRSNGFPGPGYCCVTGSVTSSCRNLSARRSRLQLIGGRVYQDLLDSGRKPSSAHTPRKTQRRGSTAAAKTNH